MFKRAMAIAVLQLLANGCQSRHSASAPEESMPLDVVVKSSTSRLTTAPERSVVLSFVPISDSDLTDHDCARTDRTTSATSVVFSRPKTYWGEIALEIRPRGQDINSETSLWVALRPGATSYIVTRVGASRVHVAASDDVHLEWATECTGILSIDVQRFRETGLLAGSFEIQAQFPRNGSSEAGQDRVSLDSSFAWHADDPVLWPPLPCIASDFLDA
jgi:hypothetical protein